MHWFYENQLQYFKSSYAEGKEKATLVGILLQVKDHTTNNSAIGLKMFQTKYRNTKCEIFENVNVNYVSDARLWVFCVRTLQIVFYREVVVRRCYSMKGEGEGEWGEGCRCMLYALRSSACVYNEGHAISWLFAVLLSGIWLDSHLVSSFFSHDVEIPLCHSPTGTIFHHVFSHSIEAGVVNFYYTNLKASRLFCITIIMTEYFIFLLSCPFGITE